MAGRHLGGAVIKSVSDADPGRPHVGDLVSITSGPVVISLTDVGAVGERLRAGREAAEDLAALLRHWSASDPQTKAALEIMLSSLAREEQRGDAFHIQGVQGAGKSHLLAVIALLAARPDKAWPVFLQGRAEYERIREGFGQPRLVVPIALDEYPTRSHPLEYVVLSRMEEALREQYGLRAALTEESHLLGLVERYVRPQALQDLDEAARRSGLSWSELRTQDPRSASQAALAVVEQVGFPLDWRRSRAEAWAELRRSLGAAEVDGLVILLDELGVFLSGKDRSGLNEDASFLQYLAQRTNTARCWLICVTQRGIEEAGDIDRRTLRQLHDRFRPSFTLDLADLEWVLEHKVVQRQSPEHFRTAVERIYEGYRGECGEVAFSAEDLVRSYPVNPLCLDAMRGAAELHLSRTRSIIRLIQEACAERGWLDRPAERLMAPDEVFDLLRGEMAMSGAGRGHLHAYEVVMANAERVARGFERQLASVMKALCLAALAGIRWSEAELRAALAGGEQRDLWADGALLRRLLGALYRRGAYVERVRNEAGGDEYYVDISSRASERMRRRRNELLAELSPSDSRVAAAALAACRDPVFPIAPLAEPRSMGVLWLNARRHVNVVCRDVREMTPEEAGELSAALGSPQTKEDAYLALAMPTVSAAEQARAWVRLRAGCAESQAGRLLAWIPAELADADRDHLLEHAALASMIEDRTFAGRRDAEIRETIRQRFADSQSEVARVLQRAYYEGRVLTVDGGAALEAERLWALHGDWEETLSAIFGAVFRQVFPRFQHIAPGRPLTGRLHTNQIVDEFIRPGGAALPPASALEAHLEAYAAPLGLVEGEGRRLHVSLTKTEIVEAALAATPPRTTEHDDTIGPDEVIAVNDLVGRLAKSEWGLTREQSELLLAALIRTGHLVGLDAFLKPVRLDQVAAPLGDSLPYVIRGTPLPGATAEEAKRLWEAACGEETQQWSLPLQERAWDNLIRWAERTSRETEESSAATRRAVEVLEHDAQDWSWAAEARSRAAALAGAVDRSQSSRAGLRNLVAAARRLPGGVEETAALLGRWRVCERFLAEDIDGLAELRRLIADPRAVAPEGSLLARQRQKVLDQFASAERVALASGEVRAAAAQWLESYRKHYLAWHARAHAESRFQGLAGVRRSAAFQVARGLAQAGLGKEEIGSVEFAVNRALARRCLAGDPLPEGAAVCPICGVRLGELPELPDAEELGARVARTARAQMEELQRHGEMLRRRAEACSDDAVAQAVTGLLDAGMEAPLDDLAPLLAGAVTAWLGQQLGRPRAELRELRQLVERLRGRELTKGEALRLIAEWLGDGEDEFVEFR